MLRKIEPSYFISKKVRKKIAESLEDYFYNAFIEGEQGDEVEVEDLHDRANDAVYFIEVILNKNHVIDGEFESFVKEELRDRIIKVIESSNESGIVGGDGYSDGGIEEEYIAETLRDDNVVIGFYE